MLHTFDDGIAAAEFVLFINGFNGLDPGLNPGGSLAYEVRVMITITPRSFLID